MKFKVGDIVRNKPSYFNSCEYYDMRRMIIKNIIHYKDDSFTLNLHIIPSDLTCLQDSYYILEEEEYFQLYSKPITVKLKRLTKKNLLFIEKLIHLKYLKENKLKYIKKLY